jgi:hypothetical protein
MWKKRRVSQHSQRMRVLLALTCAVLIAVTGCIGDGAAPLSDLASGGEPLVNGGWVPVAPGQPGDFAAFIVNSSSTAATLLSATLVPVSGEPTAVLSDIAITEHHDYTASGRSWPPGVPIRSFKGGRIGRGQTDIQFGISGALVGRDYSTAGLRIVYRFEGQTYNVMLWASATICVTSPKLVFSLPTACRTKAARVFAKVTDMAGEH